MLPLNKYSLNIGRVILKTFATATTPEKTIKVPLDVYGTRGKYAIALYTAAVKMDQLDCVDENVCYLRDALKTSPNLYDLIRSPFMNRNKMAEALKSAGKDLQWASATVNFMELVAINGRLKILPKILDSFHEIMEAHRRKIHCKVITAKELDVEECKKIEEVLAKFVKPDQTVIFETVVDPSIIGGMVVSIGDYFIDLSIAKKIEMYKTLLSQPIEDELTKEKCK